MELLHVSGYYVKEEVLYMSRVITDANRLPLDPFPRVYVKNRGRRGESSRKKEKSTS
jgi:hypothetical protein